jgi:sarcosine oxidase
MRYDAIVIGAGGVGSAALFHLATRGAKVLGLDRFPPAHDRGSSHGRTRIIRQAYYEHPDYVPLVLRAYELWADLERRCGERLLVQTGLLQIGSGDGHVLGGVRESAHEHNLQIEELSAAQIHSRWPGFRVPDELTGVFEPKAGYLRVENCVAAHLAEATKAGAELKTDEPAVGWQASGSGATVRTQAATYAADRLIITAGPWAGQLLADLGVPLEVRRKPQYWFAVEDDAYVAARCPAYLFELPEGIFYGFPQIDEWGLKVARHSGGETVADPLHVNRDIDAADRAVVEAFLASHLPRVSRKLLHHSMCMYTMSPDENFLVDRHPQYPQVAFAAGLSGHGFKFTAVLGEVLAELALGGRTRWPIAFLSCRRPGVHGFGERPA